MEKLDPISLFKCLSDKSRLLIINNLLKEPMYVELLSERLALAPSTVSFHLKKLEEAGIVYSKKEQYYVVYSVNKKIFKISLEELIKSDISNKNIEKEREEQYRKKVIEAFFEYGSLKSIPVQQKKKRIVLEEIAKKFEENMQYTEREVNIIIADYHEDFCTIRRDMVAEKLLERENGIYKLVRKY
ncbi:metalloregulator ArsR/SmtB family transcription factor [Clostridium sp. MSJ-4]|uniref:Metalloregulator ArsR/SmtB family transcription factor n=1 Tax=Clostridium simiarum TaxID=2841506 RepID=A0ABS6EZ64_9CLOT|nr:metalloregulator ArsR/SmtB family transcription factor [Clostridium simiarum]MBU5591524.1 metalloregulator ArsR/SmtB family transcription factor [Clostridium simiarum]